MIISLRGTNGSGKSHLVKELMTRYPTQPESMDDRGRAMNYEVTLPGGGKVYIVGNYDKPCGGCDGIQPYDNIWPRVDRLAGLGGHVLFEGSLVSSGYGRIGLASEKYGDDVIFAFMSTPLDQCIDFVKRRRAARGDERPFDPKNIIQKYHAVSLSLRNIRDNLKRRVVVIDYRKGLSQILGLLRHGYDPTNTGPQPPPDVQPASRRVDRVSKPERQHRPKTRSKSPSGDLFAGG